MKHQHRRKAIAPTRHTAHAAGAALFYREAMEQLGLAHFERAIRLFMASLEREPGRVECWCGLGTALTGANNLAQAAKAFQTAITRDASHAAGFSGLAGVLIKQGLFDQALEPAQAALALSESVPQAALHIMAARIHCELGHLDAALAALSCAIGLEPENAEAYLALGILYEQQGKPIEAFHAYQKTLSLKPHDAAAYNNLAGVLVTLDRLDLAIAAARMAVALKPDNPDVYLNLGLALRLHRDEEEALATYKTIVALKPDHGKALVELCHHRQHACDWDGLPAQQEAAAAHSYRKGEIVSPFAVMTASASPHDQLLCARAWGQRFGNLPGAPLRPYARIASARPQRRVRLGYLSADFYHHATAMLIVGMLEEHDRTRFELFGYSLGADDGSPLRQRLVATFDTFVELRTLSDEAAARRIYDDEIDILLDLKGFTQNARVKILAYEPAPIQVNYLGFPGTMGLPFIDYIIADAHVAPLDHEAFYDEKIVHLPHCYQPNDRGRVVSDTIVTREDCGLPEAGFVFCCFNSPYKITPDVFDIWMRLLRDVPGAVLWLLEPNRQAAGNLRREAAARGVTADRLVFAPFVTADTHLARLRLADLFLDTAPVNAHTTASEALWVGLPIVTYSGETFASRVAGSLLRAIDLPDLVTTSWVDYEDMALRLATDQQSLSQIRDRLQVARLKSPLFDTVRYTRNFERALLHMVARRDAAQAPEAFALPETI
ncbi:tetratricopeptide repeat protein [Beijerinckia sp. L45]|uniref:O-linked N-acetylglucosamine transferase family protein n=1 Tax=Beijerinckia sp. L45 TaxID=1641855 RepID=UPI00131E592D|nr:tetratricopeptide repeat protein [Beijerinckia sp. L45]